MAKIYWFSEWKWPLGDLNFLSLGYSWFGPQDPYHKWTVHLSIFGITVVFSWR